MQFPYYTFVDRDRMYTVGSLFYAIYFFVSFPMFYRMDEPPLTAARGSPGSKASKWTPTQVRHGSMHVTLQQVPKAVHSCART